MAFFKLKKRCPYCAHVLENGKCKNKDCIAYVDEIDEESAENSKSTESTKAEE